LTPNCGSGKPEDGSKAFVAALTTGDARRIVWSCDSTGRTMNRALLALLIAFGVSAPAQAWWSKGTLPPCDAPNVVSSIVQKFRYANRRTFHWGVDIARVMDITERPEVIRNSSLIGRRYCHATALLTDGRREEVAYLVESKQGFVGIGWRVESCLPDYDPWHVYGAWCRSVEP
jgi:hypothetical protein